MTNAAGNNLAHDGGFADVWQAIRDDAAIQYTPVELPQEAPPPDWLLAVLEAIGKVLAPAASFVVGNWGVIWPILTALAILLLMWMAWRLVRPALELRAQIADEAEGWSPEARAARALLQDADALAAQGRFDEAVHLLLMRSVDQIAEAQPGIMDPSTTAREIALLPALSDKARSAFGVIALRVERSLFALRALSADDWQEARAAYAEFAVAAPGTNIAGAIR